MTVVPQEHNLPPAEAISVPAIREAMGSWREARQSARAAHQDLVTLEQERPQAVARDREALADSLEAGGDDPGDRHLREHDLKIAAAQRRAEALRIVESRRWEQLVRAFSQHDVQLAQNAAKAVVTAREGFTRALDQAAVAHRELVAALAVMGFTTSGRYKSGGYVSTIRVADREVGVDAVIAALEALAEGPSTAALSLVEGAA